ncbi:MAG: alkane 1-monooxygenase [Saprospiraceae bacterium]|nr:alkane 1-monooxygenase [Saprospiraceae bacterium]MBP6567222.1 alkane 1-monooxygenase [Saprospiraceae bacterium]MBP9197169.1 alkane 1-monooxygenase [Saprospiraceae bacterium]
MEIRDLKYLMAYIIPLSTFLSIYMGGFFSYSTVIVAFFIIPVIELFTKNDTNNLSEQEIKSKLASRYFDGLLYANVIWVYGILIYFITILQQNHFTYSELIGMTLSVGIMLGSNGINVAHELGHKSGTWPQLAAKILLLPNLYMHFIIEHNYGHHLKVATPDDPATSRYKEYLFTFWIRSITYSFFSAWNIESNRLKKMNQSIWSYKNSMLRFLFYQLLYIVVIIAVFSPFVATILVLAGVTGILLLESINYVEHYGLVRRILPNGKYEKVETYHSWNSDHEAGRIILYELTRHSDHHYKANKKYQILNHYDESPQLPYGYPTSILIALFPPLWFKIMNPRVEQWRKIHLEGH